MRLLEVKPSAMASRMGQQKDVWLDCSGVIGEDSPETWECIPFQKLE